MTPTPEQLRQADELDALWRPYDGFAAVPLHRPPHDPAEAAPDPARPPAPASLIATEIELAAARLTPRCIVKDHTYADVAQVVAPGGTGKTTVLIHEAVMIALGRPVWGLPVEAPGWTLLVTAEDRREQIMARLREILAALDLTPAERATAIRGVRVWDVTGEPVKLVAAADGNVVLTWLADAIVEAYLPDPPAVVTFDPLVSFGASEGMVNDNEQGIVTAARRIVKGLDCCVRVVHHTGKGNARAGTLDQYSGRGGSALPDGSRMTTVLQAWGPEDGSGLHPPQGCHPGPDASIAVMVRAKLSYAPPNLPRIWIRRAGFAFEHFTEAPRLAPDIQRAVQADQVERFIIAELGQGRRHTGSTLDGMAETMGMTQKNIRRALAELLVSTRIVDAPLPRELCWGRRKTYLCPPGHSVVQPDGMTPETAPTGEAMPSPSFNPSPYRDSTPNGLNRGGVRPPFPQSVNDGQRIATDITDWTQEHAGPAVPTDPCDPDETPPPTVAEVHL
ncbi:AAA family ATPase [uncultured Thiodictyon sp.]|jgi:RecA-family ATPase|uniref:AAA family ATPase n=1 Tax=uncultured Thiodictyon sp. TaxID=1846217 RepID=UPI0025FE5B1C|nr:AAA family ATPase [uncultured Thiodictyon sp.]